MIDPEQEVEQVLDDLRAECASEEAQRLGAFAVEVADEANIEA